jgi:hypothetical protein
VGILGDVGSTPTNVWVKGCQDLPPPQWGTLAEAGRLTPTMVDGFLDGLPRSGLICVETDSHAGGLAGRA